MSRSRRTGDLVSESNLFVDTANDRVGIGTTNPPDKLTILGKIQVQQDASSNNRLVLRGQPGSSYRWSIDNYSSSNDFRIFREDDATAASGAVAVSISSTRNVSLSSGNLVFSTSGTGIDFSVTSDGSGTTSSELLDDYEEGTFTPVLRDNDATSTHTYTHQIGQYTKIGNTVYIHLRVGINSLGFTGSGSLAVVGGLPFTIPTHATNYMTANVTFVDGFTDNFVPKMATFRSGETQMSLWRITDAFYRITATIGPGRITATSDLEINGFYFVD